MNPQDIFCPNIDCPARGQSGKGNIHVHSQKGQRYFCEVCGKAFVTSKGTIFYRLHTDPQILIWMFILLANGCPVRAVVKAFGLDERTVRCWHKLEGKHGQEVHEHLVESSRQDLQQVQADEIKVKAGKGTYWMALAMAVGSRLWLGGVVGSGVDPDAGGQGARDRSPLSIAAGGGRPGQ